MVWGLRNPGSPATTQESRTLDLRRVPARHVRLLLDWIVVEGWGISFRTDLHLRRTEDRNGVVDPYCTAVADSGPVCKWTE